jgi:hypothetical protein
METKLGQMKIDVEKTINDPENLKFDPRRSKVNRLSAVDGTSF